MNDIDSIEHDQELWWSDGGAFEQFTTANIGLRLEIVKLFRTENDEIKCLFEGQVQKPKEELPQDGTNHKNWKAKMIQGNV